MFKVGDQGFSVNFNRLAKFQLRFGLSNCFQFRILAM